MFCTQSKVLNGYMPLALLARFFGYFPFSNIGTNFSKKGGLKTQKFRLDLFLTILSFAVMCYCTVDYYIEWPKFYVNNVRDAVHNAYFVIYRILALLSLVYFAVFQSKSLVTFLQHLIDHETSDIDNPDTPRRLLALSISLVVLSVINSTSFAVDIARTYIYYRGFHSINEIILYTYNYVCLIFSYNFVSGFIIYFNYYFKIKFLNLSRDLNSILSCGELSLRLADSVSVIRNRHEHLVNLVEEFNRILSFVLLSYVGAESVSICVNFYEFAASIFQLSPNSVILMYKSIFNVGLRLFPLLAVCATSNSLSISSQAGLTHLDREKLTKMSRNSEFQVLLLIDQLKRRKAEIQANNLLSVNNQLMGKIAGIILTYVLLMIQINGIAFGN